MKKLRFFLLLLWRFIIRYFHQGFLAKSKYRNTTVLQGSRQRNTLKDYFLDQGKYLSAGILIILSIFFIWRFLPERISKATVTEGIIGVYTQDKLPPLVTNLISQPLVTLDNSGKPQANLVSGWQVNNDATIYTFKLKDDLRWGDGSVVRSSDIKYDLSDVEVSYPDEKTIEFKLADSFSPFPTLLTEPVFKDNSLIGIGRYKVTGKEFNRNLVSKLVLSPRFKEPQDALLPIVIFRFYPDEKTAKIAFDLGEVESLIGILESDEFKNQPIVIIKGIQNFTKLVAIFYNTKDSFLSDKNFRKALSYAAPKLIGEATAKSSIPATSWAFNDDLKDILGEKETAKNYLSKVSAGKDSTIVLTVTPALYSVGEKVIGAWKVIGINAVLRVESGIPQSFQALLIQEPIPPDPDQYALWHSTQMQTNLSKYSSPRADKDLEDGRKIADSEKRKEKYADFQKVLLDDAPATFLYFPKTNIVYRKNAEPNLKKILQLQFN